MNVTGDSPIPPTTNPVERAAWAFGYLAEETRRQADLVDQMDGEHPDQRAQRLAGQLFGLGWLAAELQTACGLGETAAPGATP